MALRDNGAIEIFWSVVSLTYVETGLRSQFKEFYFVRSLLYAVNTLKVYCPLVCCPLFMFLLEEILAWINIGLLSGRKEWPWQPRVS